MPTLEVNGVDIEVDESFLSLSPEQQSATVDEIASSLTAQQPQQAGMSPSGDESRDGEGFFEKLDAGVRGAADMMTFGMADEISAGLGTGFGLLGDYDEELARQRGIDQFDAENNTGSRIAGQVAGALGGGLGMAKSGLTLAGKAKTGAGSVGLAGVEGATYGGLYGAGSGESVEDRLKQAGTGAALGAVAGMGAQKIGNALASRSAAKAASQAAPATDELANATNALYESARSAGVTIKPPATDRLIGNMKYAAGRLNDKLRPNTAGLVDDLDALRGQKLTLEQFDELRQVVGQSMKNAQPQDRRTLTAMKEMLDSFQDNIKPGDITGDRAGFEIIKQARTLNARKMKTKLIEGIIEQAKIDGSGQFTQSGVANAVRREMRALHKKIKAGKVKGFTPEETALVRQMAAGQTSSSVMRLFAKFAPRGVVSFGVGQGVGTMLPGGNILIPGAGHFAANSVDNAMMRGAEALRGAAATGAAPVSRAISPSAGRIAGPAGQVLAATPPYLTNRTGLPQRIPRLPQVSR